MRQGWLITGSRHGVYEKHSFIKRLKSLLEKLKKIPCWVFALDTIIAQALGKGRKIFSGWSVGIQEYNWDGKSMYLNAWHQDQVIEKPVKAKFWLKIHSPLCRIKLRKYILTTQPHQNLLTKL